MTGRTREHRCSMRLLLVALFLCGTAWASDEVDYSAPYLTLEDGKLVTKYPPKPHTKAAPTGEAASTGSTSGDGTRAAGAGTGEPGPTASRATGAATGTARPHGLLAAVAAVAGGVFAVAVLLARRRNRSRRP